MFMFVSGLHMHNVHLWSMLYASDNSECSMNVFQTVVMIMIMVTVMIKS